MNGTWFLRNYNECKEVMQYIWNIKITMHLEYDESRKSSFKKRAKIESIQRNPKKTIHENEICLDLKWRTYHWYNVYSDLDVFFYFLQL